jgi:hypothetical protein
MSATSIANTRLSNTLVSGSSRLVCRNVSRQGQFCNLSIAKRPVNENQRGRRLPAQAQAQPLPLIVSNRAFSTLNADMKFPAPSSDPPKHEMAYFPNMTTSLPSESGEFRRVLYTGLYSQLVLMTVPVGGDIGDEVSHPGSLRYGL